MKTKDSIRQKGRLLFNEFGVQNVTLRDIAKELNKSYGNITYHYITKEKLISALFLDMNNELIELASQNKMNECLLTFFLRSPKYNFDITLKYFFFYKDYVELKRNFPIFIEEVDKLNNFRKAKWLQLMIQLQNKSYLLETLRVEDLEYIIELSVSVRMFYIQSNEFENLDKNIYVKKINQLLYPYLNKKGKEIFNSIESST